ncbi:PREDICTED: cytochrome b561 and DOMON domain-containing protein At5g47530-like [Nicotiana attenuata]|uniref:Cytochrome b561 and DOMON domain-containing protein n=1 Tax=Nicotiana attenuata TaxID=49451 RepID=A0A1J6K7U1_NICAT|nr:PREDICTED: cytochrome b561 and DOMON domain-containing protein At5g47530-like [Nicotiana attenuata]OIT26194.1 cytochrome b561 and domon domain-containing protein [Nicotiana attenuata]
MDRLVTTLLFSSFLLLSLFCTTSYAQTQNCSAFAFRNNKNFATCNPLPLLNSVLHWTYHQNNHTVDLAYRHRGVTDSDWVAWGLNINGGRMAGAQCLVAFKNSSDQIQAYTAPIADYLTQLRQGSLSFNVPRIEAEFSNNEYIIFASLELPSGRTSFNQVWQNGQVSGQVLQAHSQSGDNMRSFGSVDFATGQLGNDGGSSITSRQRKRNVHGVLNAVSWGVLMPMGAVFARYLKVFKSANPAWFYLHVACQTSAYAVGVAGWGTGLKLGSDSVGIKFTTHRNIGITLFCLGTLQVFALLLRPKPDHKYRLYWNIYHHAIGYAVISLSITNVFEGFDALNGQKNWKRAYTGVIIALGAIAVLLEAFTWFIVIKRKKSDSNKNSQNGTNGVNGYGNGTHQQA